MPAQSVEVGDDCGGQARFALGLAERNQKVVADLWVLYAHSLLLDAHIAQFDVPQFPG